MLDWCLSLICKIHPEQSNSNHPFLSTGPDLRNQLNRLIESDGTVLEATFYASVLHLRGSSLTTQPISSNTSDSLFLWNGEIFDGILVPEDCNDGQILFERLENRSDDVSVLDVMRSIEGPYAFIYYDSKDKKIWFGRDPLGRRSLMKIQEAVDQSLTTTLFVASHFDRGSALRSVEVSANRLSYVQVETNNALRLTEVDRLTDLMVLNRDIPNEQDRLRLVHFENLPFSPEFSKASRLLRDTLDDSVKRMVTGISSLYHKTERESRVAVLFSGGLDCTTLALLAHSHIPPSESIDLLNVAFENTRSTSSNNHQTKRIEKDSEKSSADNYDRNTTYDVPDRQTGERSWRELIKLTPGRDWRFVRVNVRMAEYLEHKEKIIELMRPNLTVMDLSIAAALYFAARGIGNCHSDERVESISPTVTYRTPARVLISGLGADELLGGYSRHRSAFLTTSLRSNNWVRLLDELAMDLERISTRNLGRDDRIMSWFGREVRYPLLDRRVIDLLSGLPVHLKCDHGLGKGLGDKLLLRGLAHGLGLVESCRLPKRAIQFGARSAKLDGNSKGQVELVV
ncbi:asparagine synthase-domain-containing protein [Phakopsora pachyrhizi]|uniref:Asparagine synthase-domain-containing protein n=1 Tax=Phakopsora pachyrhizi TaxID=170000 RepID=A0AAV0AQ09_PHAPC|nr:asparagine synthase-domain-containing protein [Phakopsora pachyrhizi]